MTLTFAQKKIDSDGSKGGPSTKKPGIATIPISGIQDLLDVFGKVSEAVLNRIKNSSSGFLEFLENALKNSGIRTDDLFNKIKCVVTQPLKFPDCFK